MGWTSKNYTDCLHSNFNSDRAAEFLNSEFYDLKIEKAHLQVLPEQHEIYVVGTSIATEEKFIMLVLVQIERDDIYWKEVTASLGPVYFNCPKELLDMVPSCNEYDTRWREKCLKRNVKLREIIL